MAGPFLNMPTYIPEIGGVDKVDSPGLEGEKRKIGNSTEPHDEIRSRGKKHGTPDGDLVLNFNDMTGAHSEDFFYNVVGRLRAPVPIMARFRLFGG